MNIFGADGILRGTLRDVSGKIFGVEVPLISEAASALAAVTSAITASAQNVVLPMGGYNGATFAFYGTFAGVSGAFEASYDGATTWVAVSAVSVAGGNAVTTVSALGAAAAYEVYAPGATHLRFRSTAWTSGSMSVKATPTVFAADPAPSLGNASVTLAALPAGTALIGDIAAQVRATSGGLVSVGRLLSAAATTNATSVKAAAGRLYKIRGYNAKASVCFLKLYNKATAPTVGTDTPIATIALAASKEFDIDFGAIGMYFATGIAFAITGAAADADTTALVAADVVGLNLWYA